DGLAMSSRNTYLEGDERIRARALSRALRAAVLAARDARTAAAAVDPGMLREAATVILAAASGVQVDYVDVLDTEILAAPDTGPHQERQLLVAVAAHVGRSRLIDNVVVGDPADEARLLAATETD